MPPFKKNLKVRLILYHKGKILLLKQTKPNGGNYSLVGGNIESSEFARQTLIRESYEEAGIILQESDLQLVHVLHKTTKKKKAHRIVLYFKAYKWEDRQGHIIAFAERGRVANEVRWAKVRKESAEKIKTSFCARASVY